MLRPSLHLWVHVTIKSTWPVLLLLRLEKARHRQLAKPVHARIQGRHGRRLTAEYHVAKTIQRQIYRLKHVKGNGQRMNA